MIGLVSRGARPILLLVLAVFCFSGAMERLTGPLSSELDAQAQQVTDDIAVRAAAAFAISRTINAALSFAEDVTLSAGFLIVEGSINPGSVLEPVNNLVGQFADAMLLIAVAALLLKIVLGIGVSWGLSLVLASALTILALATIGRDRPWLWQPRLNRLGFSLLFLAFVLRLALPAAIAMTGTVSDRFLVERYVAAKSGLDVAATHAEDAAGEAGDSAKGGLTENLKGAFDLVRSSFGSVFNDIVTMLTVFALETMIVPLTLLWLLYRGSIALATPHDRPRVEVRVRGCTVST